MSNVKETADLLTVSKVAVYPIGADGMMNDHWIEGATAGNGRASGGGAALNGLAGFGGENDHPRHTHRGHGATGRRHRRQSLLQHQRSEYRRGSEPSTTVRTITPLPTRPPTTRWTDRIGTSQFRSPPRANTETACRRGYNADDTSKVAAMPAADPFRPLLIHGLPSSTQLLYGVRIVPAVPQPPATPSAPGKNAAISPEPPRATASTS